VSIGRTSKIVFALIIIMLATTGAWAVSSSLWESDSKDDFDAGEPDGVSVTPPGQITLGPEAGDTPLDAGSRRYASRRPVRVVPRRGFQWRHLRRHGQRRQGVQGLVRR